MILGGVDIGEGVGRGRFGFGGFASSHVEEGKACLQGCSLWSNTGWCVVMGATSGMVMRCDSLCM